MADDRQILVVSEAPRQVAKDRNGDAARVEDSVRSWGRDVVIALRALAGRVSSAEKSVASLSTPSTSTAATSTPAPAPLPPTPSSAINDAESIGAAVAVYKGKSTDGKKFQFRTIKAGSNISVQLVGDVIEIGLRLLRLDTTNISPTGVVQMWPATIASIPAGWLFCDGSTKNIADFPALAAVLGTTYGGDGITTFGLPDSRDRFPIGPSAAEDPGATGGTVQHKHDVATGATVAITAVSAGTPAGTIDAHTTDAETVAIGPTTVLTGPTTHTFTGAPLATHTHPITGKTAVNENGAGSTATADVLPPYLKVAFIIKT